MIDWAEVEKELNKFAEAFRDEMVAQGVSCPYTHAGEIASDACGRAEERLQTDEKFQKVRNNQQCAFALALSEATEIIIQQIVESATGPVGWGVVELLMRHYVEALNDYLGDKAPDWDVPSIAHDAVKRARTAAARVGPSWSSFGLLAALTETKACMAAFIADSWHSTTTGKPLKAMAVVRKQLRLKGKPALNEENLLEATSYALRAVREGWLPEREPFWRAPGLGVLRMAGFRRGNELAKEQGRTDSLETAGKALTDADDHNGLLEIPVRDDAQRGTARAGVVQVIEEVLFDEPGVDKRNRLTVQQAALWILKNGHGFTAVELGALFYDRHDKPTEDALRNIADRKLAPIDAKIARHLEKRGLPHNQL